MDRTNRFHELLVQAGLQEVRPGAGLERAQDLHVADIGGKHDDARFAAEEMRERLGGLSPRQYLRRHGPLVVTKEYAGPDGLYFELRVDGQPVDPLQWLKKR